MRNAEGNTQASRQIVSDANAQTISEFCTNDNPLVICIKKIQPQRRVKLN